MGNICVKKIPQSNLCQYSMVDESEPQKQPGTKYKTNKMYGIDVNCQNIDVEDDDSVGSLERPIERNKETCITDFTPIKLIGKGSYGKVLLVQKKKTNEVFAMKVMKKQMLEETNRRIRVQNQRKIMENIRSPFIVQLYYAFQSETRLYLVMDFMVGGELFFHILKEKKFSQHKTMLYAAQIVLALEYLHNKNIIYRDLKAENILVGSDGYLKIADFGLSKVMMMGETKSYSICGTPQYLAPQILLNKGHGFQSDWWSLGALIYEMLTGLTPFYSKNQQQMFTQRLTKSLVIKKYFSPEATSLLQGLLNNNPQQRLGHNGIDQIKNHAFFNGLDWNLLLEKKLQMPFKPNLDNNKDTKYFDRQFTKIPVRESPTKPIVVNFEGYSYEIKRSIDRIQ